MKYAWGLLLAAILAVALMPAAAAARGRKLHQAQPMNFTLPPLPYAFNALEPSIDNQTMYIHHDLHHAAYVRNLNAALAKAAASGINLYGLSLSKLCRSVGKKKNGLGLPADQELVVRNNACGAWNHALFWRVMAPTGSADRARPDNSSALAQEINRSFGSIDVLINQVDGLIGGAAVSVFGSGWAWLVVEDCDDDDHPHMSVVTTPNQDNPLNPYGSKNAPLFPILGIDVWEHAYYLKYQNRRPDYTKAWIDTINWKQVALNYDAVKARDYDTMIGADANLPK